MVFRSAYPIRERNIPYDSIRDRRAKLRDNPTQEDLDAIWKCNGTRCAYRAARIGAAQTIKRALAQASSVSEVGGISLFPNAGHLDIHLNPHGEDFLFSMYQILMGVGARRGIQTVYIIVESYAPAQKL